MWCSAASGDGTQELAGKWSTSSVMKNFSVVNSWILFAYSALSLMVHGDDWALVVPANAHSKMARVKNLRLMKHLDEEKARAILLPLPTGDMNKEHGERSGSCRDAAPGAACCAPTGNDVKRV